jgi:hypothetical protein
MKEKIMNENEMNSLENQLRSWQPRRASGKLKRRIFPSAARHTVRFSLQWLAPAAACLLLAMTILNQEARISTRLPHTGQAMEMLSSNLSFTNILPDSRMSEQNGILPASFKWTNLRGFTSSISPFSTDRVN